jgi:hypothetical protein
MLERAIGHAYLQTDNASLSTEGSSTATASPPECRREPTAAAGLLSAVQTLRLRGPAVSEYLAEALDAYRHGSPAPKLLTAP